MARRKLTEPTKAVTFRLTKQLAANFELLLLDPVANRTSYGKKSLIAEALISRTVNCLRTGESTIDVSDLLHHFGGTND